MSRYVLDKSASSFTVRVFPTGLLSGFGHSPTFAIRDFSGEATLDADHPADASVTLRIRADSLEVMDDIKSSDRREIESTTKDSVLETSKYPEITFSSTRVTINPAGTGQYQAKVDGSLSLHGTTQGISVPVQVMVMGDMQRASGEFSLSQAQFGIQPVSLAGGAMKLKDEVKFKFDMVSRQQE